MIGMFRYSSARLRPMLRRAAASVLLLVGCAPRHRSVDAAAVYAPAYPASYPAPPQPQSYAGLQQPAPSTPTVSAYQTGEASWYGEALRGHKTASGEPFNPDAMTAAHRTLRFGTWVLVRRIDTGVSVRVRITDRGPFAKGRILDLSRAAASQLGMLRSGVADVALYVEGY
jgi:rare lipoprotein A